MKPECSLPHSQVPATCPNPYLPRSSLFPHIPLLVDASYYLPIYAWVFKVVPFSQVSPPKTCISLASPPYMLHAPHTSFFSPHIPLLVDASYYLPIYSWVFKVVPFPQVSPPKTCISLASPPYMLHAPPNIIFLDLIVRTISGEEYRSLSSSLCSFFHSTVPSSLLGPNFLLNTLSSNTLNPRSSLSVSDQVSHSHTTKTYIIWYRIILSSVAVHVPRSFILNTNLFI